MQLIQETPLVIPEYTMDNVNDFEKWLKECLAIYVRLSNISRIPVRPAVAVSVNY